MARAKMILSFYTVRIIIQTGIFLCLLISDREAEARSMTSQDLARVSWVEEACISPDGNYIAYLLKVQRDPFTDDGEAYQEVHVCDPAGNSRPFVAGEVTAKKIGWTPEGNYISYLAERFDDEEASLYIIPIDGGESQKIVGLKTEIKNYSWAPDGRRVALVAEEPDPEELDSLKELGFDQEIYEEDWQPYRVWIYDRSDMNTPPKMLELDGSAFSVEWSPVGEILAVTLAPTPLIDDKYMYRKVCLVDAATGELIHKYDNPGKLGKFAWSPDGNKLAFITGEDEHDPREGELVVASISNGDIIPVLTRYDGHVVDAGWLNNETLIYRSDQGVYTTVGRINIDGSDHQILIPPDGPPLLDMTISRDGRQAAFIGSDYDHDCELYYCRVGEKQAKRLTNSNPWFDELEFGRQETIIYNSRDGLKLQGILIYPVVETEGQKYPLILYVHGGPESHNRNGWLTWYGAPGQVAAGKGFAVFYPNYRGSTGRGVEFSKMGQADYAGGEFNDLVDAIMYLGESDIIDTKKVGITGRSYGGFATAWASTALTEYFAAGVMGVGISDLISKFGTTDIPMEMYLVHARHWPWDKWQWYLQQSPIYHSHKSETPLLIFHGEDDTRVHPSQSMEMYRYLKTNGRAPVRLVFYPDEEHGTTGAAARYDSNLRMMRWLEHYLLGPGGEPPPYEIDYPPLSNK